jgi:hypothetical protein
MVEIEISRLSSDHGGFVLIHRLISEAACRDVVHISVKPSTQEVELRLGFI